jgi:hypothetical protein
MLTLPQFHRELLGKDRESIPESYRLTGRQLRFYHAFEGGKRGFMATAPGEKDPEAFVATTVAALYQTMYPTPGKVSIVVTPATESWYTAGLANAWRQALRVRFAQKVSRAEAQPLVDAMGRVYLATRPIQMAGPPERWVNYGFTLETPPTWVQETLF